MPVAGFLPSNVDDQNDNDDTTTSTHHYVTQFNLTLARNLTLPDNKTNKTSFTIKVVNNSSKLTYKFYSILLSFLIIYFAL